MKRRSEEGYNTRSKKGRLAPPLKAGAEAPVEPFYVSGTDVRNYMIKDPLVDWFRLVSPRSPTKQEKPFTDFLLQRGKDFESKIVEHIRTNKLAVVSVSDKITPESCRETVRLMKEGVPLIHSAPFKDSRKHIKGVIDFLVRSDHLHLLVNEFPIPEEVKTLKAPKLSGNYHYVVIDVKFSTLPLRADGIHLLNSGSYPAYKAQLWIYTNGIASIQGYTSRYAFILGRRYSYVSKGEKYNSLNCLDRLGVVDFEGVDREYITTTGNAINWLKDLRQNGKNWTTNPPSREELYPNMCIDSGEWNQEKKKLAESLGDITQIWYCGIKNRKIALEKGIKSWRDSRCRSDTIGINGSRAPVVDKIIDINRQKKDKIRPFVIKNNIFGWKDEGNEMFVDFETFCDVFAEFDDLPEQRKTDLIFMIGVYYRDTERSASPCGSSPNASLPRYTYTNFIASSPTEEGEYQIMDEFVSFVRSQGNPKLWFWHADQGMWERAENRQMDLACAEGNIERADHIVDEWKLYDWGDLCQVFRDEPIVVRGCYKFGLKEIAEAMRKNGLIRTKMESDCTGGMDASIRAWKVYEEIAGTPEEEDRPDVGKHPVMRDIAKYNEFDVSVLQDILFYLRTHHV